MKTKIAWISIILLAVAFCSALILFILASGVLIIFGDGPVPEGVRIWFAVTLAITAIGVLLGFSVIEEVSRVMRSMAEE